MRLQRSISRRIESKQYVKHQVVLPNSTIKQVGWNQGEHLDVRVTPKGMLIFKVDPKQKPRQLDYDEFKGTVTRTLTNIPKGCTWSELRLQADLKQRTPSSIWVRRMQDEGILIRVRDPLTSRIIWKLTANSSARPVCSTLNGWTRNTAGGGRNG